MRDVLVPGSINRNFTFAKVCCTCMNPTQTGLNVGFQKKLKRDVTWSTMASVWVPTILILEHQPLVGMLPWQLKDVLCLPVKDDVRVYCRRVNERERERVSRRRMGSKRENICGGWCEVVSSTLLTRAPATEKSCRKHVQTNS